MHGNIKKFRDDLRVGIIRTEDGRTIRFSCDDVSNPTPMLVGLDVDFVVESNKPKQIVVLAGSAWTAFGQVNSAANISAAN